MAHKPNLLRQDEAWELLRAVEDPVISQLVNRATFHVTKGFSSGEVTLSADFDLRFFAEVMVAFFSNQEALRRILSGEDLRMWPDEEGI